MSAHTTTSSEVAEHYQIRIIYAGASDRDLLAIRRKGECGGAQWLGLKVGDLRRLATVQGLIKEV